MPPFVPDDEEDPPVDSASRPASSTDAGGAPAANAPALGEEPRPSNRAPPSAADAPASRVGSVINDSEGNPLFCLVQLWACRRKCESCENAFCQATFADRTYQAPLQRL